MNSLQKHLYLAFSIVLLSITSLAFAQVTVRQLSNAEIAEHQRHLELQQQQLRQLPQQTLQRDQLQVDQSIDQSIDQAVVSQSRVNQSQTGQEQTGQQQAQTTNQVIYPFPVNTTYYSDDSKQLPQQTNQQTQQQAIAPTVSNSISYITDAKAEQVATIQALKQSALPNAWPPNLNSTWQVQLFLDQQNPINTSIQADIYDIEIDAPQAVINELKARGHKVICYLNAGTAESFRPSTQNVFGGNLASDTALLEKWRSHGVLGNVYGERFSNEFWMNPNNVFVRTYVQSLLNKCKNKGFDGVSFDNLDGFSFDKWNPEPEQTGFSISADEQLAYNLWLADEAHKRGLYAGLKNTAEIAEPLSQAFDWVFVESCYSEKVRGWEPACENYARHFATKGKAIYLNEYDWNMQTVADENNMTLQELRRQYCAWAEEDGIFLMFRENDTKSTRLLCRDIL